MAKRPKNRKVDRSMFDQGAITPLRALAATLLNRRENKKDRKYQEELEEMGVTVDGGGKMSRGDGICTKGRTKGRMV